MYTTFPCINLHSSTNDLLLYRKYWIYFILILFPATAIQTKTHPTLIHIPSNHLIRVSGA